MIRTIFITAGFFVVVMMVLLAGMEWGGWFRGDGEMSSKFERFSLRQVTIFFTAYVFFQVWNQINCRSLVPEASGLSGLWRNPTFLMIAGTIAVVQILIVSVPVLGRLFEVEPLGWRDWFWILLGTSSVLVFAEAARRIRLLLAPTSRRKAVP
jgi:Ca2+-transporting ATPase